MTTEATAQTTQTSAPSGPIVARAGTYYRWTRYIMVVVLLLYGAWSIYDGFISWPNWTTTHPKEKPKSEMDINFNKGLGVMLPPLALILLVRSMFLSRGSYRLENGIVYVPGHSPVPLDRIQAIHREKWDTKGIADIDYDLSDPSTGQAGERDTFRLDDFVYQRDPTDEIFKQIEASLLLSGGAAVAEDAEVAPAVTAGPMRNAPAPARTGPAAPAKANPPPRPTTAAPAKGAPPARPPGTPVPPRPVGSPARPPVSAPASGAPARPAQSPLAPKPPATGVPKPGAPPRTPPPTRLPPRPKL